MWRHAPGDQALDLPDHLLSLLLGILCTRQAGMSRLWHNNERQSCMEGSGRT